MKKGIFTLLAFCLLLLFGPHAFAKVWRVNNNAGVTANFTDFPAAVTGASAGDTIRSRVLGHHLYSGVSTLSKKLTIIGCGYYLSGTHLNPNTQANTNPSTISYIYCIAGSAGTVIGRLWLAEKAACLLGDK